jgi:phospholipase/carboxylesterase
MPGVNSSNIYLHQGQVFRTNMVPNTSSQNVKMAGLLIHGWNGDENAMQIFFTDFPDNVGLIAPRAPYPTNENGYTWASSITNWNIFQSSHRYPLDDLRNSADTLVANLKKWTRFLNCEVDTFYVAGFSQGGALALILGLFYPTIFTQVACLSGFLPDNIENELPQNLIVKSSYLITHGSLDEIVPVEKARETYQRLNKLGFQVDYCEDRIGHKIGVECRKKLVGFFNRENSPSLGKREQTG